MISSLYVHIPFCESICDYCDFTKLQYFHNFVTPYLKALKFELNSKKINKNLKTIYVGGGTPSSLSINELKELLEMLKPYSQKVKEYTFEANPESLDENKIKLLKEYGVNRISLGVESTDDKILKSINRHHTFNDVERVVSLLRENGIENINLDLILGLPNVTKKMMENDIDNILKLNPNHISAYSLTVHPHTVFYLNKIEEPNEDFSRDLYDLIHEKLSKSGYIHYEISNFSKPGYYSLHNLTYWNNEEYYAIGLGASGYEKDIRYKNTTSFSKYINNEYARESEKVSIKDLKEYEIMLRLRTIFGINVETFNKKFNCDLINEKRNKIESFIEQNLLYFDGKNLAPTYEGMMILDQIILALL